MEDNILQMADKMVDMAGVDMAQPMVVGDTEDTAAILTVEVLHNAAVTDVKAGVRYNNTEPSHQQVDKWYSTGGVFQDHEHRSRTRLSNSTT